MKTIKQLILNKINEIEFYAIKAKESLETSQYPLNMRLVEKILNEFVLK